MLIFILLSLSLIAGMGVAVLAGATSSGLSLLLAAVFFTCSVIPIWFRHGNRLVNGDFAKIREDEEPLPVLSIFFLMLACGCIGSFRYISALNSDYSGHLRKICDKYEDTTIWNIRGRIIEEPKLKNDHLEVLIKLETIRRVERKRVGVVDTSQDSGKNRRSRYETIISLTEPESVKGGFILAQVFQDADSFRQVSFNQMVEIEGQLTDPSERRNPGSFNYKQYLRNRGVYRTIRIIPNKASLRVLAAEEGGSLWYRLALYIKHEVLKVIKKTMPYPESSFLGGVLLGLKGGLPAKVTKEFRMTGVSHVLAVSGLHVTIIAGLLYGIFTILKIPSRFFAPIIVFSLFTFALIVGWPSSAVRAALMNSLFILSQTYLKKRGFKLSVVFSLCVASDFILLTSPLQLTEPSFVLSVMAIYALAVFSEPSCEYLQKILRGPGLAFAFLATLMFYLVVMIKKSLVIEPWFFSATFIYIIAVCYISGKLADISSFQSFAFEMLPVWIQTFLGAQIAIFIAMMGPLSAFYFGQLSLAAPVANMVAIPLIGLIVQIGLIAGLVGAFIPVVGIYIALILNAANWLAVKFFMVTASFFAVLIPFPRVSQPGFAELAIYYLFLHLVFFRTQIKAYAKAIFAAILELWEEPDYRMSLTMLGALLAVLVTASGVWALIKIETKADFRITQLDVGFGAALLIEKGNLTILIDAGLNDTLAGVDRGEKVIQPALSEKKIAKIDAVILSSCLPERISGLASIFATYKIGKVYAPFTLSPNLKKVTFEDYVRNFSLADMKMEQKLKRGYSIEIPPNYYWELAYESYNRLIEDVKRLQIQFVQIKAGDKIDEGGGFIEVLAPAKIHRRFSAYYDGLILKIRMGEKNILFCSGNVHDIDQIASFYPDYIFLADLPYPYKRFERYIKASNPEGVGISFRLPSSWLMDGYHLAGTISARNKSYLPRFKDWWVPVYVTAADGAIFIEQKGNRYRMSSFLRD